MIAINAVFEISNSRDVIRKIEIIAKGGDTYNSLFYGGNTDKETAYIAFVRNYYEDDLKKIVKTLEEKNDNSFVIFVFADQVDLSKVGQKSEHIEKIDYNLNESKYESISPLLNEYFLKHWTNKEAADEREKKQVEELLKERKRGIGDFLTQLKFIYNGMQATEDKIAEDLRHDNFSSLFILNLFEMMSQIKDQNREIDRKELESFYDEFCTQNRSKMYNMEDFEVAINTLLGLCVVVDEKIILLQDKEAFLKEIIVNSSREMNNGIKKDLFQMMIFFWLYNCRKVNFKSLCYREYLTYLSPEQLCNYILNVNIALKERINISFETSEIIAEELKGNIDNNVLKDFIEGYIIHILDNRKCLVENEDMISFQSIYRIFRGILVPDMEKGIDYVDGIVRGTKSHVGYLGYIEGVCSANIPEYEAISAKLKLSLADMLDEIFQSTPSSIQYMAYDILYNYEKEELRKKYFNSSWENICASLHGNAELTEENNGSTYMEWKNMREKFMDILKKTSASIRKRNMVNNTVEERK